MRIPTLTGVLVAAALMLAASMCQAGAQHQAKVLRVVDGDTFDVEVDVWPGVIMRERVRVTGSVPVDTPEMKAKQQCERDLAVTARLVLTELLEGGIVISPVKRDEFGRILAAVALPDGRDLGAVMIQRGIARVWRRGSRGNWC